MSEHVANERLFLNADKTKIVPEDDPEARFLLAGEGDEIPEEYQDLPGAKTKRAAKAEDKAVAAPANKAAKA